jgi:hypothetical protein
LAADAPNKVCNHPPRVQNQPQSAASTSRSSFVNGKDDITTESHSSFIQGKDDTTIEPLSAAERDYSNDDDSYKPYPHNRSDDETSLGTGLIRVERRRCWKGDANL